MSKWLSRFAKTGWLANLLVNAIYLLGTNWVLTLSTLIAIVTVISRTTAEIVGNSHIQLAAISFLVVMWTLIGLLFLKDRKSPVKTIRIPSLAYGLGFENFRIGFERGNDHACYQIGVVLRNVSGVALRYTVEQLEVRIKARSMNNKKTQDKGGIIPFGVARSYWCDAFPKSEVADFIDKKCSGTIDLVVAYGPYNGATCRRLAMSFTGEFLINEAGQIADRIVTEKEEAISD